MLRHYDQVGLLTPARVDPHNGYRFYSPGQLRTAARIRALRDAGCGISQIADLLPLFDRADDLRAALAAHGRSLEAAAEQVAAQQSLLSSIIEHVEEKDTPVAVQERDFPALRVLALRRTIRDYAAEGGLWAEFGSLLGSPGSPPMSQFGPRWGATYFDPDYREAEVDVAVWGEFSGAFEPAGDFLVTEFPSQKVAWATLVGPYDGVGAVSEAIGRWTAAHGYTAAGPMFNINVVSPAQDRDPANWVTEVNYPVAPPAAAALETGAGHAQTD